MGSSVSSAVNPVKSTKTAIKAGTSAVKNTVKAAINPIKATKETLSDPLGQAARFGGLDVIFGTNAGGPQSTTQAERAQYNSGSNEDASAQERSRMISRQSSQGTNPIMLLGQDFQDPSLNHDEKLGGKES